MAVKKSFQLIATLSSGLFAGAAIYINLVEHPARMSNGTEAAVNEWRPSYKRATVMQASLAVIATLSSLGAWATSRGKAWLGAAAAMGTIPIYTLTVIFPTNKQLENMQLNRSSEQASQLLARWARLHAARSVVSLSAFGMMAWELIYERKRFWRH